MLLPVPSCALLLLTLLLMSACVLRMPALPPSRGRAGT